MTSAVRTNRLAIIIVLGCVCTSVGQTTQPATPARVSWPDVVAALADTLVRGDDPGSPSSAIRDDALIRRFDKSDYDDFQALSDALSGTTVVATHGYLGVPNSIASDLAVDFRDSPTIPEDLKTQLVPDDEVQAKRANVTAAQWVTNTLAPATAQPVGLIVLLRRAAGDGVSNAVESFSLSFVLIKAEQIAAHQYHITHVVYGDTRQIMR